jgi:hypothetical protein
MSAAMSSRFVSATKRDEEHAREVAAEPKTTGPQILQGVSALELFSMSVFLNLHAYLSAHSRSLSHAAGIPSHSSESGNNSIDVIVHRAVAT